MKIRNNALIKDIQRDCSNLSRKVRWWNILII